MPIHTFTDPGVCTWARQKTMPPQLATLRGHSTWYDLTVDKHPRGWGWNDRKVANIREAHEKWRTWHFDKSHKPSERMAFGERWENRAPHVPTGFDPTYRKKLEQTYHISMPQHGIYSPPHYEEPCRAAKLPPIVQ